MYCLLLLHIWEIRYRPDDHDDEKKWLFVLVFTLKPVSSTCPLSWSSAAICSWCGGCLSSLLSWASFSCGILIIILRSCTLYLAVYSSFLEGRTEPRTHTILKRYGTLVYELQWSCTFYQLLLLQSSLADWLVGLLPFLLSICPECWSITPSKFHSIPAEALSQQQRFIK